MANRVRFFLWAALALQGCVSYQRAPLSPKASARQLETRTLADPGLQSFLANDLGMHPAPGPHQVWDLGAFVGAGYYFNPDLRLAMASAASAKAAIRQANAWPNPTLSWFPNYDARSAAGISPWTVGFTLDLLIETAGKRGARIDQARQQANAALLNVASAAWAVRGRVRKALVDLYSATLAQEILNRQSSLQRGNVGLLEQRLGAGEISAPELSMGRISASQSALQLQEARKLSAESQARLASALGLPANALQSTRISFRDLEEVPNLPLKATRREALVQRADVLAALADYAETDAALRLEIAKQYPDIHLNPGYEFDQGLDKYAFGLTVTLPVFDQNRGGIAAAETKRKEAAARFLATQAKVLSEIDGADASLKGARQRLKTADALLAAQRKQQTSVQAAFDAGAVDRLQLRQSQLELTTAELSRTSAFIEAQTATGLLEDALQHPAKVDKVTAVVLRNLTK